MVRVGAVPQYLDFLHIGLWDWDMLYGKYFGLLGMTDFGLLSLIEAM